MTEERKQEIVDAIVAAFRATGLLPKPGVYYVEAGCGCACAVGVIYAEEVGRNDAARTRGSSDSAFRLRFGVDRDFTSGVISAFDGEGRVPGALVLPSHQDGRDVGRRVRKAVGL